MKMAFKPAISDVVLAIVFIAGIAVMAATYASDDYWIGHAILGSASLALILSIDIVGAMAAKRIPKPKNVNVYSFHRKASGWFLFFSVGAYLVGIVTDLQTKTPIMSTQHGILGLVVCIIAVPQWLSCRYKVRGSVRVLHILFGYGLLALKAIQFALGLQMAFFGG
jgi:hypothetical protein